MDFPNVNWRQMDEMVLRSADTSDWIAVLPLGATEQHGPHLPLETDSLIAGGICDRLKPVVAEGLPVTFLPVEEIGYSPEHADYPGSRTLEWEAAIKRWISFGEMLNGFGIRKMLLLNAHGGNSPLMTIVATELRCRFEMLCVATSWSRFGAAADIVGAQEKQFGIHGGDIETSAMLYLHPDQVRMDQAPTAENFQRELADKNRHLKAYGPHAFGWKMQDLNPLGVTGNAAAATAQKGEMLVEAAIEGILELLQEIHDFDLRNLKKL